MTMKKVLFVDDEPFIAKGLSSILEWDRYGIEIAGTANDGSSALDILREQPVDLLVTDIMMPRMNGLELIRRVKESGSRTKFVVLSGYEEFAYVKTGIRLGIENYILKPINLEELESTIRHIRGEWDREELEQVQIQEDWEILRSNVLQRWVSGEIESQEFKQRAELLGLPLKCEVYRLFVTRLVMDETLGDYDFCTSESAIKCREIAGVLERLKPKDAEVVSFFDQDGDLVILYAHQALTDDSAAQELRTTVKEATNELEGSFWIADGGVGSDFLGVQGSYRKAKSVFRRFLLPRDGETEFTCCAELEVVGIDETVPIEWNEKSYLELLIQGRPEEVGRYVEEVLSGASTSLGGLIPRQSCLNIALRLMLAAKEQEESPDYSEVFASLGRISSLPGLMRHVVTVVQRSLDKQGNVREEYTTHVAFMIEQVHRHYSEELSLKTLSQKAGLHPNYLGQLFQQEVGSSFSDYVNQYRIEKATQLLLNTDRKTAEIALSVGYLDTSYFYRQFKKYSGVSPTELRQMYTK